MNRRLTLKGKFQKSKLVLVHDAVVSSSGCFFSIARVQFTIERVEWSSKTETRELKLNDLSESTNWAIDHSFYGFTGAINHAGRWENTRKACKSRAVRRVIYKLFESSPNIQVVYGAGRPIERVVYRFYEITMKKVCQWEEHSLYFRDQVDYSHQIHKMTRQTNHSDWKNKSIDSAQGLQKTNMPLIERSFYLLNTRTICAIFLYNWTQCIDGFSLLSQIYVRKGKDGKNSAILSFFFVTERTQLNATHA